MALEVLLAQGSLTAGREGVLVNASNTNARLGSGVSGAIRAACGGDAYQHHLFAELERQKRGPMEPGDVMITDAGSHPHARYVAHVAVMDYREGFTARSFPTLDLVRAACARLWSAIEGIEEPSLSVAMVALGAGTGQLGVRGPTEAACETLLAANVRRIERVVFYGFDVVELAAIASVVTRHFPAALASVPEALRPLLKP